MGSTQPCGVFRKVELFVSAERVLAGHSLSLEWKVVRSGMAVSSVQLASASASGLDVIESIPEQGRRQMIFSRPGRYTFTLTVTFQDGQKRCKQVGVQITS